MFHRLHPGMLQGPLPWLHLAIGAIFWLALIALVVAACIALLRRPRTPAYAPPPASALDILNARYARGEIDAATYQEMRNHILGGDVPPPTV